MGWKIATSTKLTGKTIQVLCITEKIAQSSKDIVACIAPTHNCKQQKAGTTHVRINLMDSRLKAKYTQRAPAVVAAIA